MEDTIFGLPAQSHAKLSHDDLQSMGKQAAVDYLTNGTSLNDAVIKLAKMHPSISTHQVRRVVEYANQETFSRLFTDGEKYANDKNIDFDVADPGAVLHSLEIAAQPEKVEATPDEYGCEPMKTAHADVEADLALAREFGVDLATPGSERTSFMVLEKEAQSNDLVITNIMTVGKTKEADGSVADRIMMAGEEGIMPESAAALSTDQVPDVARQENEEEAAKKEAMGPIALDAGGEAAPGDVGEEQSQHPEITHRENMRAMERRIELEKKKQELVTMQAKSVQTAGDMGGAPPPPGDEAGPPPAGGGDAAPPPPEGMGMDPMAAPPPGGAPMGPAGGMPPPEMMAGRGMPPPTGPMPTGPAPGLPGGGPFPMKKAHVEAALELTKQAMDIAKTSSKHAAAVLDDLREGVSIERIKQAAAAKENQYPEANPFGDLIRMKQKLAKILDDATHACDKNNFMMKEARDEFLHQVTQHMFNGGNLGEITHAVSCVTPDEETVKVAMDHAINHLITKGLDITQAQAHLIQYEMEKGASARPVNPNNPIVESFSAFCKIAKMQDELEQAVKDVRGYYNQVEGVLSEAMKSDPSA